MRSMYFYEEGSSASDFSSDVEDDSQSEEESSGTDSEEYPSAGSSEDFDNSELEEDDEDLASGSYVSEADNMPDTSQSDHEFGSEDDLDFDEDDQELDEENEEFDEDEDGDEEFDENYEEFDEDEEHFQEFYEEDEEFDEDEEDFEEIYEDDDDDQEFDEDETREQETGTGNAFEQNVRVDNEDNAGNSGSIFDHYGDYSNPETFQQRDAESETPAEPCTLSTGASTPMCPVCMDTFEEVVNHGVFFVAPPCGHGICYKCACSIKNRDPRRFVCPVCRKACEHQNVHRLFL